MKVREMREKSPDELQKLLFDLKEEQFNLRVQSGLGQLENTARKTQVKRDIARVKTLIAELNSKK